MLYEVITGWERGLAEPLSGMAAGKLQPAETGTPASAVWHFRTPYIVSDAEVKISLQRKNAADRIRLLFSSDEGKTWSRLWDCPDELVGDREIVITSYSIHYTKLYDVAGHPPSPPPAKARGTTPQNGRILGWAISW